MPAPRNPSWQAPKYSFTPQACQLCSHPMVYRSRSLLSDHATIHHGCWYSSLGDRLLKSRRMSFWPSTRRFTMDKFIANIVSTPQGQPASAAPESA